MSHYVGAKKAISLPALLSMPLISVITLCLSVTMDGETWTSMAPAPPDPKKNDDEGIAMTAVVTSAETAAAPVAAATPAEAQAQVQAEKIEARGGWLKMCIFAAILVTVLSLLLMLTATEKKNSSISLSAEGHGKFYFIVGKLIKN
jgi:hypothetical protein